VIFINFFIKRIFLFERKITLYSSKAIVKIVN